jgi:5-amino-6-(5-phospho-D-ribitylamino)uracil phosphatase
VWRLAINNQIKLLVLDLDGTILDKHGNISDTDFKVLEKVRSKGIAISICTGRAAGSCKQILNRLSLDGLHVFCDGALVCNVDFDREVLVKPIQPELLKRICKKAAEYNLPIELYSSSTLFIEHETWITNVQRKFFGIEPHVSSFDSVIEKERIIKCGLIITSPEEETRTQALSAGFKDDIYFSWARTPAYPMTNFINITAAGVSKGAALEALTTYLGLRLEEVMAIGDGNNDLTLLSKAGFSVAMQNAPDEVKSVADYVTAGVEQSGAAQAIQKFLI